MLLCLEFSFCEFKFHKVSKEDYGEGNSVLAEEKESSPVLTSAPSRHTSEGGRLAHSEESFALCPFGGTYYEQSEVLCDVLGGMTACKHRGTIKLIHKELIKGILY